MQRFAMPTALVFAAALALSGCAAGGGGGDTAGSTEDNCTTVAGHVRDISNGVQNTLASATSADELEEYLEEAKSRVTEAADEAESDDLETAVDDFAATLEGVGEYADGLEEAPSEEDPETTTLQQDPDALAEQQAAVQEAAGEVASVCSAEEE
ncbi:hypothetical protein ACFQ58_00595 [Agromyces sp. NPDC056523]|uniref:hypothetical protein n=1 Tax=Agromyces sp. NPDC056523 TaxID=3345850 RepID=UPI00366D2690